MNKARKAVPQFEINGSTFLSRKAVDKDLHTSFNFKLVSGNIYDCVHK